MMETIGEIVLVDGLRLTIQEQERDSQRDYGIGVLGKTLTLHNPYGPAIVNFKKRLDTRKLVLEWLANNIEKGASKPPLSAHDYLYGIYILFGSQVGPLFYKTIIQQAEQTTEGVLRVFLKYLVKEDHPEDVMEQAIKNIGKIMYWDEQTEKTILASILLQR